MEEQDADAVDVALDGGFAAREQLGREVERRARHPARPDVTIGVPQAARAEVHEDDASAFFAHHVAGLDVAMDEAGGMRRGERAAQLAADQGRFARAERALRFEQRFERPPAHELHRQADAAFVFLGAVDVDDVGVADAGHDAAFVQHPRGNLIECAAGARPQQLQRDVAMQGIAGAIDLAERAFADLFDQRESAPRAERHTGGPVVRAIAGQSTAACSSTAAEISVEGGRLGSLPLPRRGLAAAGGGWAASDWCENLRAPRLLPRRACDVALPCRQ